MTLFPTSLRKPNHCKKNLEYSHHNTYPPTRIHAHTSALPLWLLCFHWNIIPSFCPLKKMTLSMYLLFPISSIVRSLLRLNQYYKQCCCYFFQLYKTYLPSTQQILLATTPLLFFPFCSKMPLVAYILMLS